MRSVIVIATLVAAFLGSLGLPAPAAAANPHAKVAIIVGPVGEELTPVYISLADAAAKAAEKRGADVARAYSPDADGESVAKAVRDANIVIYFGHGVGSPNPYSDDPSPLTTNGWGLNGPGRHGDHSDSFADGSLTYYGEEWITKHARPAPGWVMIYSNACYAPGAGEADHLARSAGLDTHRPKWHLSFQFFLADLQNACDLGTGQRVALTTATPRQVDADSRGRELA